MIWDTTDELVGQKVYVRAAPGEEELATVVAVGDNGHIMVKADDDGALLSGNQWEEAA